MVRRGNGGGGIDGRLGHRELGVRRLGGLRRGLENNVFSRPVDREISKQETVADRCGAIGFTA
jgi:hypothetical protein